MFILSFSSLQAALYIVLYNIKYIVYKVYKAVLYIYADHDW